MGIVKQITPPFIFKYLKELRESLFNYEHKKLIKSLHSSILFDGHDQLFKEELSKISSYGEFGCGQSTIYAYKQGKDVVSVESDKEWVTLINSQLESNSNNVSIIHTDIGETGNWGWPVDYSKRHNFHSYAQCILDKRVELVLIDGRFRVACFLELYTRFEQSITVIFDDYVSRQEYHVVEEIIKPVKVNKRQAIFYLPKKEERDNIMLSSTLLPKFEFVMT